jgi:hypothetical protein
MDASPCKKYAIGVTLAAAVVFVAAFMPWGKINGNTDFLPVFWDDSAFGGIPFQNMTVTLTMTGWNGNINLGGLVLVNWLVVLAAAGVTSLAWLKTFSAWDAPKVVPVALAAYGLFHAGFAFVMLMSSSKSSAGAGSFLTAVAFAGILVILIRQVRGSRQRSASELQP